MPGPLTTEAVVLRSMRYGEADRILHLYTPGRGRIGAIAKGVRRARSRFGGRLEPFFVLRMGLHEGRSELLTVTSAETLAAHPRLREHAGALDAAARSCDAVARLFDSTEPHPEVYNLLCRMLVLLDEDPAAGAAPERRLAFRLKLLLAAGFMPHLSACASCGEPEEISSYSPAAGGVVCSSCQAGSFPLDETAHAFLAGALGRPLADAPSADERVLRVADRVVLETAAHHAHVRLRAAA